MADSVTKRGRKVVEGAREIGQDFLEEVNARTTEMLQQTTDRKEDRRVKKEARTLSLLCGEDEETVSLIRGRGITDIESLENQTGWGIKINFRAGWSCQGQLMVFLGWVKSWAEKSENWNGDIFPQQLGKMPDGRKIDGQRKLKIVGNRVLLEATMMAAVYPDKTDVIRESFEAKERVGSILKDDDVRFRIAVLNILRIAPESFKELRQEKEKEFRRGCKKKELINLAV